MLIHISDNIYKLVDCEWNDWKDKTACSKSCGHGDETGTKKQTRTLKTEHKFGGTCDNVSERSVSCTTNIECPSKFRRIIFFREQNYTYSDFYLSLLKSNMHIIFFQYMEVGEAGLGLVHVAYHVEGV